MFKPLFAVYFRNVLIYKKRILRTLLSILISPALYALAFGWGIGKNFELEGVSYFHFILPGLLAISTLHQSFSIGTEINIARFINKFFEEYLTAPVHSWTIVAGYILWGMTRTFIVFSFIILLSFIAGFPPASWLIFIPVLLTSLCFSSLGIFIALIIKTHRDMSTFNTFVIIPMSFLAGTFFSIKNLPVVFRYLALCIPLTHSSILIRSVFMGNGLKLLNLFVLILFTICFCILAVHQVNKAVN